MEHQTELTNVTHTIEEFDRESGQWVSVTYDVDGNRISKAEEADSEKGAA